MHACAQPVWMWFWFCCWSLRGADCKCVCRPAVSQQYNQGAVNLSGPQPSYPQHYAPPNMQQVTNQMTGMQISSGPPTAAGPVYGTVLPWLLLLH